MKLRPRTPDRTPHLVSYMVDEGQSGWRYLVTDGQERTASHPTPQLAGRAWNTGDVVDTVNINDAIALAATETP